MTLASMVFSIGLMIYLNVMSSLPQGYKVQMQQESTYLLDSLSELSLDDQGISFEYGEGATAYFDIQEYDSKSFVNTWMLTCTLEDSLGNIFESVKIKYLPEIQFE